MILISFFLATAFVGLAQVAPIRQGVVSLDVVKCGYDHPMRLYNEDGKAFATVFRDRSDDEFKVKNGAGVVSPTLLDKSRAFYAEYGLMILDTDSAMVGGMLVVYVGGEKKLLDVASVRAFARYRKWPGFLVGLFIKLQTPGSLYTDTLSTAKSIARAEAYSYTVKSVHGDWAYVVCAKTCEECPAGKIIKGWVRWRKGNTLLVELYYEC